MALSINANTGHILVDVSSGSKTIRLPRISDRPGRIITIKDTGFASILKFIRIETDSSPDTFEKGFTTFFIDTPFTFVSFIADSSTYIWRILATSIIQLPPQIQAINISYIFSQDISSYTLNVSSISSCAIVTNTLSSAYTYANSAYIENLSTNSLIVNDISTLTLNASSISSSEIVTNTLSSAYMYANTGYIENLSTHNIVANDISSLTLNVSSISTSAIVSNTISSSDMYAKIGYIESLSTNNFVVNDISSLTLNVSSISSSDILSHNISTENLYVKNAFIENISANVLYVQVVSTTITQDIAIVNVDTAYISSATISTLHVFSTFATHIDSQYIDTSTLSSGQATFISSVEIQGGLSVFSTIGAYGLAVLSNVTVGGTLDVTGLTTLVNSSNTGTLGVGGLTTLSIASTIGQAAFYSSVQIQGGLSVFSTIGAYGLAVLSNTTIGGTLDVTGQTTLVNSSNSGTLTVDGLTTLSTLSTIGQAAFYSSVQIQGGLSVFSTIGAYGLAVLSNTTIGGTLDVTGQTTLMNTYTETLTVDGLTTLSTLSTIGQAAFYSSVQIQGGLSVFSTIGAYGLAVLSNVTVGGTLNVTGLTTLVNSSNTGTLGVDGLTTLSTLSTIGQAAFYSSVQIQGGLSVFSTIGAYGLAVLSNVTVGGTLDVTGQTTLVNTFTESLSVDGLTRVSTVSTIGQAAFYSSVQIQGGLSVFSTIGAYGLAVLSNVTIGGTLDVTGLTTLNSFNRGSLTVDGLTILSTLSTIGQGTFYSSVQMQGGLSVFSTIGAYGLAVLSNTTIGGTLDVTGLTTLVNSSNTGTLGVDGLTTLSIASTIGQAAFYSSVQIQGGLSVFSTIGAYGLAVLSNTSIGGTLDVTGQTTLVNTFTGTLTVDGLTRLSTVSTIGQAAFYSSVQIQGGLSVFSTIGAYGLAVLSNTSIGGTLDVTGLTTLVNSSNTGSLGVAGLTTLSKLSTIGQAAFFSSVQIQGGLSVFSTIGAEGLAVSGRTVLNTVSSFYNETQSTSTINAYIQNAYIQNLSVSYFTVQVVSTLTTEYISAVTITDANISSANISSLRSGQAIFNSSVHIQGGLSVFSTIGAEAISIDSEAAVGGTLQVKGLTTLANTSNTGTLFVDGLTTLGSVSTGQAAFFSSVQIQGGLSVFSTIGAYGLAVLSNTTLGGTLDVTGLTTLVNSSNTGTLGVAGLTTLGSVSTGQAAFFSSVQIQGGLSVFSTIGAYGLAVLSNTTIGGTLQVTDQTTLSNTSNTGILGVAGSTTLGSNVSTIGQAAFFSSVQIQGGLSVFSTIGAYGLAVLSNVTVGGTLQVTDQTTLSNTSNTGILGVAGLTTLGSVSTIGQAAFFSSVQIQGGLSVFSSLTTTNINFTGSLFSNGVLFTGGSSTPSFSTISTIGQAAFFSSVQIQGGLSVFSSLTTTNINFTGSLFSNGVLFTGGSSTPSFSTISTIGQAAFFSSVQIQGGLSVFSSLTTTNINFTGQLTSNGNPFTTGIPGINTTGTVGINSASNASFSLLVTGNQSNTGTLGLSGQPTIGGTNGTDGSGNTFIRLNQNLSQQNWSYICSTNGLNDVSLTANCYISNATVYAQNTAGAYSFVSARQGQIKFWCGANASITGVGTADSNLTASMLLNTTGLNVTGDIVASGNVTAYSDMRIKENITSIDSALDKIMKMRGVYYTRLNENTRQVGVIAQEVEEILPEVVMGDTSGMKSVAYGNMVGLLIEGIKEMNNILKSQDSTIKGLSFEAPPA